MQIRLDDLATQLGKGLKPCYVVHGDEALLAGLKAAMDGKLNYGGNWVKRRPKD